MTVVTVGIDLAKNIFAVHGVNAAGKAILVKPLVCRAKLLELIATLPALSEWKRALVRITGLVSFRKWGIQFELWHRNWFLHTV